MISPDYSIERNTNQQRIFQNNFPPLKKQLNTKQEVNQSKDSACKQQKNIQSRIKGRSRAKTDTKKSKKHCENQDSLYQPPDDISDSEYFREPQKKIKLQTANIKSEKPQCYIQKSQCFRSSNYPKKLRVRDVQAISHEQFQHSKPKKKQTKNNSLIYDVDLSQQIYL